MAGHRLGALEGAGGIFPHSNASLGRWYDPTPLLSLHCARTASSVPLPPISSLALVCHCLGLASRCPVSQSICTKQSTCGSESGPGPRRPADGWGEQAVVGVTKVPTKHTRTLSAPGDLPIPRPEGDPPTFESYHADRFSPDALAAGTPMPLGAWVWELPDLDPRRRFTRAQVQGLIPMLDLRAEEVVRETEAPSDGWVLSCVREAYAKHGQRLPKNLEPGILALDVCRISLEHAWALLLYSVELYDADGGPAPSQIHREFNLVCRRYGFCDTPDAELQREWGLFRTFAFHLDAAIRSLPSAPRVLYRGMTHSVSSHHYPVRTRGALGGCISASSDHAQAAGFVIKESALEKAPGGSFFMILSDEARPMFHLSQFPEELEHMHPLDLELEVCSVLPASIAQMLSLSISIVGIRRVGARLSLELWLQAIEGLGFIYDGFLQSYVPPNVKVDPHAIAESPFVDKLEEFFASGFPVLVVAAKAGMGKTACALWLSRKVRHLGFVWLFISLPAVKSAFTPFALVHHVMGMFGLQDDQEADAVMQELKRTPVVLILDSLDEAEGKADASPAQSWWDLNEFSSWAGVKLLVTCREDQLGRYQACLGPHPQLLYLQPFGEGQIQDYVKRRLLRCAPGSDADMRSVRAVDSEVPSLKALGSSDSSGMSRTAQPAGTYAPQPRAAGTDTPVLVAVAAMTALAAVSAQHIQSDVEVLVSHIAHSRIRGVFSNPFQLQIGLELLEAEMQKRSAGAFHALGRESDLYRAWLRQKLSANRALTEAELDADVRQTECLAKELHSKGIAMTTCGAGAVPRGSATARCGSTTTRRTPSSASSTSLCRNTSSRRTSTACSSGRRWPAPLRRRSSSGTRTGHGKSSRMCGSAETSRCSGFLGTSAPGKQVLKSERACTLCTTNCSSTSWDRAGRRIRRPRSAPPTASAC